MSGSQVVSTPNRDSRPRWDTAGPQITSRRGFALAAALLALLLIAALVAGVLFGTTEEAKSGAAAANRETTLRSAESAIEIAIDDLRLSPAGWLGVGESRSRSVGGVGAPTIVYTTRVDSALFWLVASAGDTSPNAGVARRIGVLVKASHSSAHPITIDRLSQRAWSELF